LREEILGHFFYLAFVVESEVSPLLDYDEIELGELISKGNSQGTLPKITYQQEITAHFTNLFGEIIL
jgi:hypothetical protein